MREKKKYDFLVQDSFFSTIYINILHLFKFSTDVPPNLEHLFRSDMIKIEDEMMIQICLMVDVLRVLTLGLDIKFLLWIIVLMFRKISIG